MHAGSAPALDLVPLAALGFGLCLLYRYTGSLYPCIAAHSLNNSLAFAASRSWGWQIPVLIAGALLAIAAAGVGVQARRPDQSTAAPAAALAIDARLADRISADEPRLLASVDGGRGAGVRRLCRRTAAGAVAQRARSGAFAPLRHPGGPEPGGAGRLALAVQKAGGSPLFALVGRRIVVRGIVSPYVGGQAVKVSFYPRRAQGRVRHR